MSDSDGCLADWCAADDWCEITCAADVVSNKWHPVIVHRLLERGPLGFNRLKEAVSGISGTVLSDSLEDLEENGIVERTIVSEKPFRVEYSLTAAGEDLEPVIAALREWGATHLEPTSCR